MRLADREIKERTDIDALLERVDIGHLALSDRDHDGAPYLLPFNFFYDRRACRVYLHCAAEGRKLDIVRKDPRACFEVCEVGNDPNVEDQRCPEWWKSVVATGTISFVEDVKEKKAALDGMIMKYGRSHEPVTDENARKTTVLALDVKEVTGKFLGPDKKKEKKETGEKGKGKAAAKGRARKA